MTSALATASFNPLTHPRPLTNGSDSTGSTSAQSASISANDFLTLLVTEMKNQDPTAQTDPNEYINQLVQVNSLQQLIEINQNLSTALGDTSGTSKPESSLRKMDAMSPPNWKSAAASSTSEGGASGANGANIGVHDSDHRLAAGRGNLSVPAPVPAAQRVAHSLSGHR